ncbi:hypothetical protein CHS0354_005415 [Potamilus streckersoni]|uniref:Uncharacterized protein n=1 Tax=Potamilus streckersoni TaxID=2493646 RepID=A0AAE0T7G2_9BIVA|nr:hypothetical protein CHS0354_005415 [Potamilus streckersoni]
MSLQSMLIFVFLSSLQFCQVKGQCNDQPGVIKNGKTCIQLYSIDCYDPTFLSNCCQACAGFYTGVTGCEYGDTVSNCNVVLCMFYTNPTECCATCKATTVAPTPSPSTTTTTIPTLATTATTIAPTFATTLSPTLATTTPSTTVTTAAIQTTITTTPKPTIAATTATTSKKTATVTPYYSTTSSSQVPAAPLVSVVSQTTKNITLNVILQAGSTVNEFEINASTGVVHKIPLPAGNVSVEYVFSAPNNSGTCFTFEIVAINAAGRSAATTVSNACYAPLPPLVTHVAQTATNVTLNLTLALGSLGNTFEVKVTGAGTNRTVSLALGGSRSIQYVLDAVEEAGTCFFIEVITIVTDNPIKSQSTIVRYVCYAPQKPEVNVIAQTTSNVTINITLSTGSLGNIFEVNVTGGGTSRSVSLSLGGSRSMQHEFNEMADAGTCFKLDIVTVVTNNLIKSDTATIANACYAPKRPEVTVVTQTTSSVTLNITLPVASLGSIFEVNVTGRGMVRNVSLAVGGSRSVQYVLNETVKAGTCFSLEIVNLVINNPIKSDKTDVTSACYAPKMPEVNVITQTTSSVTLNITLPTFSLGNTFEIKVTGGGAFRPFTIGISRSLQHVFNEVAEAGTCFRLEFVIVVTTNPIKSDTTTVTNACYAPSKPQVDVVAQTTMNITMNIALPTGSLGNKFEIKVKGGMTSRSVPFSVGGSRSVQHVFNEVATAGTCFDLEIVTIVTNNPIKSDESVTSSCYVPFKPTASVVEQSMNYISFNIVMQAGSTGKSFNVKFLGGKEYDLEIPEGSTGVHFVFNEAGTPGTCFTLQAKTLSVANVTQSEASSITNICYAPNKPQVYVVETTTKNIKLNISISSDSLAKSFQIRRTGDMAKTVDLPAGTTSALYVFDSQADAGTCFTFEIVAIAADDRARSNVVAINNTCYASFPVQPGSLSAEEKIIVAVSSVGGLIFVCCAAAVLCIIAMKMKKALKNKAYSPPQRHGNQQLRPHYYGNPRKIPDNFGTYYPTHTNSYEYQRYNQDPMTNYENIQDYLTYSSQFYNWGQLTPLRTFKRYRQ